MKRVIFDPIDKSVIHKSKITDNHVVIISTGENCAKYLLTPISSYSHGMNGNCITLIFTAIQINSKTGRLNSFNLIDEKEMKDWVKYSEEEGYQMFIFNTMKDAFNALDSIK